MPVADDLNVKLSDHQKVIEDGKLHRLGRLSLMKLHRLWNKHQVGNVGVLPYHVLRKSGEIQMSQDQRNE